jgi:hypothetical protein
MDELIVIALVMAVISAAFVSYRIGRRAQLKDDTRRLMTVYAREAEKYVSSPDMRHDEAIRMMNLAAMAIGFLNNMKADEVDAVRKELALRTVARTAGIFGLKLDGKKLVPIVDPNPVMDNGHGKEDAGHGEL